MTARVAQSCIGHARPQVCREGGVRAQTGVGMQGGGAMEHGAATRRQQIIALLRGRPWEAGELSRALGISGSVSKVEMIPLHCPSKGIAVDKQANDEVVHLCGFREANGLTDQALNACP